MGMKRSILRAGLDFDPGVTVGIDLGGTDASTAPNALIKLGGVPLSEIDNINKPIRLDNAGNLPSHLLPLYLLSVSVKGPRSVVISSTNTYLITDYSSDKDYTVTAPTGTVTLNTTTNPGEITYIAPGTVGQAGFLINGRAIDVTVKASGSNAVIQPQLLAPQMGTSSLGPGVTFYSSPFEVDSGTGAHAQSDWEVATNSNFSLANIVASSYNSNSNLTSFSVSLIANTDFWVRVRYKASGYTDSIWSRPVQFRTKDSYLPTVEIQAYVAEDRSRVSVAVSDNGNTVVFGNFADTSNGFDAGAVLIYTKSGSNWIQSSKLLAGDGGPYDMFGHTVGISGDGNTIAVGCPYDNNSSGSVYIFARSGTNWNQQAKLTFSESQVGSYFGWSLDLSENGSVLAAGAPGQTHTSSGALRIGACVMYKRTGSSWQEQIKLLPNSVIAASPPFSAGQSVAVSGDGLRVIFGSSGETNDSIQQSGAAYVYVASASSWLLEQRISPAGAENISRGSFGSCVEINSDGSAMFVSATGQPFTESSAPLRFGAVYNYVRSGSSWSVSNKIQASDGLMSNLFGLSMKTNFEGNVLIVGAPKQSIPSMFECGEAYIFSKVGVSWVERNRLFASDKAANKQFGTSVSLSGDSVVAPIASKNSKAYIFA
jgi:hypothetical protein